MLENMSKIRDFFEKNNKLLILEKISKIRAFLKKELIIILVLLASLVLVAACLIFKQKSPSSEVGQEAGQASFTPEVGQEAGQASFTPGSHESERCSVRVEQPECQKANSPTLTLKWENCAKQKKILVLIDDTIAANGKDFPNPEYNSGEIENDKSEYTFSPTNLKPGTTYHPSVTFITEGGEMSGWRDTGLFPFVFNDFCK